MSVSRSSDHKYFILNARTIWALWVLEFVCAKSVHISQARASPEDDSAVLRSQCRARSPPPQVDIYKAMSLVGCCLLHFSSSFTTREGADWRCTMATVSDCHACASCKIIVSVLSRHIRSLVCLETHCQLQTMQVPLLPVHHCASMRFGRSCGSRRKFYEAYPVCVPTEN